MGFNKKNLLRFSFIALLFLTLMAAWLGFGERGFIYLYRMEKERQTHMEKIRSLEKENQALLEEIERLRTDNKYLESVARTELGLVKDDEILYRFSRGEEKTHPSGTPEKK